MRQMTINKMLTKNKLKILFIDDDRIDCKAFDRFVAEEELNYKVDFAHSCGEALIMLGKNTYDLVLLDYMLPDGTGLDILAEASQQPTIFITGNGDESVAVEAMKNGAADYIVKDTDRSYLQVIPLSIRNIIKSKEVTDKLKEQARQLEESNSQLEQFAYVASHDLQEPLRMITSYCKLLERRYTGKLDSDADEFIEFIVDGTNRMKALIDDLLIFSRAGRKDFEHEPTCLNDVLSEALKNLDVFIQERRANVQIVDLPVVNGHKSQLVQLIQNLISNGIKFCTQKAPKIIIQCEELDDHSLITIEDNGIGIPAKESLRIFSAFQRLHTREEYPGSGIGLAICKKIVESMQGKIWVESEINQGSTFYIKLPKIETK